MGLAQLGGVFIVLTGGVIVACFAAVGEFLWENRQMTAKGVCINFWNTTGCPIWMMGLKKYCIGLIFDSSSFL